MNRPIYYIGLDLAADSFTAAIFTTPVPEGSIRKKPLCVREQIINSHDGFCSFDQWLQTHKVTPGNSVVCLEATGVYGEALCYYLAAKGYQVAVEPPQKVKRAFDESGHKTDVVDSRQIAEYAYRFVDELNFWQPNDDLVEQIKVLLTSREQFTAQLTANQNSLHALKRKPVQNPLANQVFQQAIHRLKESIKAIDQEIKRLIDQNPRYGQMVHLLTGIPGVGLLLAANLLVITRGFTRQVTAKQLAAYVGICPYQHTSGKSVYKKARTRHYGPSRMRKLLYLAALSLRTHNQYFQAYFRRKVAEGKAKRLVINNIANKLLKVICAIMNTQTAFIPNYKPVSPIVSNRA